MEIVLTLFPALGHTYFSTVINGLEAPLVAAGYNVIFGDTRDDPQREMRYTGLIEDGLVDGVLLFTGKEMEGDFATACRTVPVVLACRGIAHLDTLSLIEVANREAARAMTEHLIALGHRRIAHISGPAATSEAQERIAGFRDALNAAELTVEADLIWPGNFNFVAGERAAERFLALDKRPTAVFAASDEIAIGFIGAVKASGLSVPGDVSVAGFDGIDYSAMYDPGLTTALQPRAEIGRHAAEELLRRMAPGGAALPPRHTRLPCSILLRNSTAAPPQGAA